MEDWIKIASLDNIYQAEMQKAILENSDIQTVIINTKDSLFLIGEIDLYVSKDKASQARKIISQQQGLSKINSFVNYKPMELFHKILVQNGINASLIKKEDHIYILDNFEIYVPNEEVELTVPFLTGDKLIGWEKVEVCNRVSQTKFRVDILAEHNIDSIVIKKRDSNFRTVEVHIYVRKVDVEKSIKILTELNGWIKIDTFDLLHRAEHREDLLKQNNIPSIIKTTDTDIFDLYVETHNEENAIDIINKYKTWTKINSYESNIFAQYVKDTLIENGINVSIVEREDPSFLLSLTDLYVDNEDVKAACFLIEQMQNLEDLEQEPEQEE